MTKDVSDKDKSSDKSTKEILPIGIDKEETRSKILSELIKAEDYYVKKIHSARHSIAHEILSDSSAIIGTLTTFQFTFIKSLLAVSPIVAMLVWEQMQAKKDLKRLHRVAELFRKTRDPKYFHFLGLELEGIPQSRDLTKEQIKKVEDDIHNITGQPTSFGHSLKNLRTKSSKDINKKTKSETPKQKINFSFLLRSSFNGVKSGAIFLKDAVVDLKNITTLPKNYLKASFVIAQQSKDVIYQPLKDQFNKISQPALKYLRERRAKREVENSDKLDPNAITIAKVKSSKTATFAANPNSLAGEISNIKQSIRKAGIESTVNGVAFICQTAFIVNQALATSHFAMQDQFATAFGIALPSLLALSPLNYFAKNQIDKQRQLTSKRAEFAKRLDERAKTLKAVEVIKEMIGDIQKEKDEKLHLKMAKELVDMFGKDFNPDWFEKEHRTSLQNLFNLVATHKEQKNKIENAKESEGLILEDHSAEKTSKKANKNNTPKP
jgi:hypothetical protein